jgi:hypothetical protein
MHAPFVVAVVAKLGGNPSRCIAMGGSLHCMASDARIE